MNSKEC